MSEFSPELESRGDYENRVLREIRAALEEEVDTLKELERDLAWACEPRPLPAWITDKSLPLGHIAFQGDFDAPKDC